MKKVEANELDGLLSPKLREILQAEIKSGNRVKEACFGAFTNTGRRSMTMKTPVRRLPADSKNKKITAAVCRLRRSCSF